jgi:hypothetical protein
MHGLICSEHLHCFCTAEAAAEKMHKLVHGIDRLAHSDVKAKQTAKSKLLAAGSMGWRFPLPSALFC